MKNLLTRLRRTGFLFLIGVFLIVYVGLGILYFQQSTKQKELTEQIAKQGVVAAKPLPAIDKLKAESEEVKLALAPLTDYAVLETLVKIARESGINIERAAGKFTVPPAGKVVEVKIGDGKYQVLPIKNLKVQGNYASVMKLVADLDAGKTLKTMVLKKAVISEVEIIYEGTEKERRQEWRDVQDAVKALMADNRLKTIPHPRNYDGEIAFNDMTAFPDILSSWVEKVVGRRPTPRATNTLMGTKRAISFLVMTLSAMVN